MPVGRKGEEGDRMERFVICKTDKGHIAVRPISWAGVWNERGLIEENLNHIALFYDDEEAKKFVEWKNAEEQGLLLKLPCKVGDTVYVKMQSGEYAEAEVRDFTYFLTCGFCIVVTSDKFDKCNIPFTEFGKTVFFTIDDETKQ